MADTNIKSPIQVILWRKYYKKFRCIMQTIKGMFFNILNCTFRFLGYQFHMIGHEYPFFQYCQFLVLLLYMFHHRECHPTPDYDGSAGSLKTQHKQAKHDSSCCMWNHHLLKYSVIENNTFEENINWKDFQNF